MAHIPTIWAASWIILLPSDLSRALSMFWMSRQCRGPGGLCPDVPWCLIILCLDDAFRQL